MKRTRIEADGCCGCVFLMLLAIICIYIPVQLVVLLIKFLFS